MQTFFKRFRFSGNVIDYPAPRTMTPVRSMVVSALEQATELKNAGDAWGAYRVLRDAFERNPAPHLAEELCSLMGTTSNYHDVMDAMNAEFDMDFYMSNNADVRHHTQEGDIHYLLYGWKEGRNPSRFFDHAFYAKVCKTLDKSEFPLAHYLRVSKPKGIAANPVSSTLWYTPQAPSDVAWAELMPAMRTAETRAVVILPVYKGYDETLASVYHALASRDGEPYSLLVVNDKSPDPELSAKLDELAGRNLFDYFDSPVNRGFVQTINYALEHLSGDLDVVLLNSDAYTFPGWFGRLIRHADEDASIATVTPLSNNATICSYPVTNQDNFLALELAPAELDALAATANAGRAISAPTGVGFCFYMRRSVIDEVGLLDAETFKVGYGEENDFCMRALNAGYRNVIAGDVFVFHTGSVSFSTTKDENYNRGQTSLSYKHPNYLRLVRNHISAAPELHLRRRLDAARLATRMAGCTVFVAHRWAGGIDTYLADAQQALVERGQNYLTLRVHDLHFATIEVPIGVKPYVPNLSQIDLRTEWAFLEDLIQALAPGAFHVNSFAGLDWSLQRRIIALIGASGRSITFIGHDYSPISHHYQLIRPDNAFVGVPDLATRVEWSQMRDHSGSVDLCDPRERLECYSNFFAAVDHIEVPSLAAKEIYAQEFPSARIVVVPHRDHLPEVEDAIRRPSDGIVRIAIVGAIGPHKGSDVLAGLATDAKARDLPVEYHLIGYSNDDGYLQSQDVRITGPYTSESEALDYLDEIQPDLFLIPSIWPETFCYTLSMALKKKIPPVVFNLGAQAERVGRIRWGTVLPHRLSTDPTALSAVLLSLPLDELWSRRPDM